MELPYIVTRPGGIVHPPAYPGDLGYDLEAVESVVLEPGDIKDIPVGVAVELPVGKGALLTHRSSAPRRLGIQVLTGTIDNGFRGELFGLTQNITRETVVIQRGTRFAQLLLVTGITPAPKIVERLSDSPRGQAGFGSSGLSGQATVTPGGQHDPAGPAYPHCVPAGCPGHPFVL